MARTSKKVAHISGDLLNITEAEVEALTTKQLVTLIRGLAGSATANRKADDGWVYYESGKAAALQADTLVEVRLRKGIKVGPRRAASFSWAVTGGKEDILAYRIVDAAPAPA